MGDLEILEKRRIVHEKLLSEARGFAECVLKRLESSTIIVSAVSLEDISTSGVI